MTGLQAALIQGDQSLTAYRHHCHMLACGMDPKGIMAELTGREGGYSRGKGGSMHMFSKEKHFYGGHGIVGAQVSLGTGIAFNNKYAENGNVCCTYFGDGASNQGQVYESFNMAKLWDLPVIYIIENNNYAMGTSVERTSNVTELYTLGESYDMPSAPVDAMDVIKVKEAMDEAVAFVRGGNGPMLLEMKTYRYKGHSMSDPAKYRTREEVQKMRDERDPIEQIRDMLLTGKHATDDDLKAIDKEIKAIVNEAAEFSKESPEPALEELWTDIYAEVEA